jgi:hypothetical protein
MGETTDAKPDAAKTSSDDEALTRAHRELSADERHDLKSGVHELRSAEKAAFSDAILLATITACGYATACMFEVAYASYFQLPMAAVAVGYSSIVVAVLIYVFLFVLDLVPGEVFAHTVKSPVKRTVLLSVVPDVMLMAVLIWITDMGGWVLIWNLLVVVTIIPFRARRVYRAAIEDYSGDRLAKARAEIRGIIAVARSPLRQAMLKSDDQIASWLIRSVMAIYIGFVGGYNSARAKSSFLSFEAEGKRWVVLASDQEHCWIAPWNAGKNTIDREYRKISQIGVVLTPLAVSSVRTPHDFK